jgi:hypothetical protein
MPVDRDYLYEGLLRYNFLPMVKERRDDIPPLFSSEGFAPEIADKLIHEQDGRAASAKKAREMEGFDQVEYRTTRFNNIVRLMHIPHPCPFARLCACMRDHWDKLEYICDNAQSQIKPQRHEDGRVLTVDDYGGQTAGRVVVMEKDRFPEEARAQLDLSFGCRYRDDRPRFRLACA